MVSRLLTSIGPNSSPAISSGRRTRRDLSVTPVGSAHRRSRRSLDDMAPPSPSNDPPLLRVKRLEEEDDEEKKPLPPVAGLQRMKRIDEELNHGSSRRRRRAALTYDPQLLIDQIVEYMREWEQRRGGDKRMRGGRMKMVEGRRRYCRWRDEKEVYFVFQDFYFLCCFVFSCFWWKCIWSVVCR